MELQGFDDRDVMFSPVCEDCRHADPIKKRKCTAYPDGIPLDIWCGMVKHFKPQEGDHGIRFEQMTDEEIAERDKIRLADLPRAEAAFEQRFPGKLKRFYALIHGKEE